MKIKKIFFIGIFCVNTTMPTDWSLPGWTVVKAPSLYVGTCWHGSLLKQQDGCNDWCGGPENVLDTACSQGDLNCRCKPGVTPGANTFFNKVGDFIKDSGNKITDAFKSFGGDIDKGFDKLKACSDVASLGTQLAAKLAARQTVLSGQLTDSMVEAARQSALQPLYAARDAAQEVLNVAEAFLEKAAKPIATGTLKAGEVVATGVLTATDEFTKTLLSSFDVQKIHYDGSLQELFNGTLGNVSCQAKIFSQNVNFNFSLNVRDPIGDLNGLANKIAKNFVEAMKTSNSAIKKFFMVERFEHHEDMIRLAMGRKI